MIFTVFIFGYGSHFVYAFIQVLYSEVDSNFGTLLLKLVLIVVHVLLFLDRSYFWRCWDNIQEPQESVALSVFFHNGTIASIIMK